MKNNFALKQPPLPTKLGSDPIPLLRVRILKTEEWASAAYDCLEKVRSALLEGEKNFLLFKDLSYFKEALTSKSSDFIGVLFGAELVGMAVVRSFSSYAEALTQKAVTCNLVRCRRFNPHSPVCTIQSVATDAGFKGHNVGKRILDKAIICAQYRDAQALLAQASVANTKGCELFVRNGFRVETTWTTDVKRALLVHPLVFG